jgi:transcriptional regulator with XRE-family HTH domain
MDAGKLIKAARHQAGISQAELANRLQTDRGQISRHESGRVSPRMETLARLLAACDLQVRATLVPLMADVDAQVDAILAGEVSLDTKELANLVLTLEDDPAAVHCGVFRSRPVRKGPVTWAFDSHTALQLQGLAVQGRPVTLAVVPDAAARYWLRGVGAKASRRDRPAHWLNDSVADLAEATGTAFFATICLQMQLRLVDELPPTLRLAVPWLDRAVPVVTAEAVEQAHPQHAEVLARLRERRG